MNSLKMSPLGRWWCRATPLHGDIINEWQGTEMVNVQSALARRVENFLQHVRKNFFRRKIAPVQICESVSENIVPVRVQQAGVARQQPRDAAPRLDPESVVSG